MERLSLVSILNSAYHFPPSAAKVLFAQSTLEFPVESNWLFIFEKVGASLAIYHWLFQLGKLLLGESFVESKFPVAKVQSCELVDWSVIVLPSFKINQIMVKDVSRYLVENGHRVLFEPWLF